MARNNQQQAQELRILNAVAEALSSSADVEQALAHTLELVAESLGLQTGWVWLLDHNTQEFYNAAVRNLPLYLQEPIRMTGHTCWCIEQFRTGKLTPKNINIMECSRLRNAAGTEDAGATGGLRCHASIPLYFQERPLGIMNVTGPSWRELTPNELKLLSTIAYQVGLAIERARLAEESTRLARVEERTRIAREIHDTLAQGLTGIALHIESALLHLESNPRRARERLQRALVTAQESLEEARQSVLDLRAAPLSGKSLSEALGALGRAFTSETGVRVHIHTTGGRELPLSVEAELYRIAQEALTNVHRHTKATEINITLQAGPVKVRLTIQDNGCGFSQTVRKGGQGILGMSERAKLMAGTLRIRSQIGHGTTVVVVVPLAPAVTLTSDVIVAKNL